MWQCCLSYTIFILAYWKLERILVQFFILTHVGHVILQSAEPSHPALSFILTGTQQVQALPGSSEDHCEALILRHWSRQKPQRLGLAAFTHTLHFCHCDWKRRGWRKREGRRVQTKRVLVLLSKKIINLGQFQITTSCPPAKSVPNFTYCHLITLHTSRQDNFNLQLYGLTAHILTHEWTLGLHFVLFLLTVKEQGLLYIYNLIAVAAQDNTGGLIFK